MNKKSQEQQTISIWNDPICFIAFGFGVGKLPYAQGTFGTLVGVLAYLVLQDMVLWVYISIVIILFVVGIFICQNASNKLFTKDHPGIVWDEIVGYLAVMTAAPKGWLWIVIGFLLFRFFDILKPWPIYLIDRKMASGFGIMLDDLLAALYASFILQLLVLWIM